MDSSFDVAVIITLRDRRALAAYLAHPRHHQATRTVLRPLVQRVRIYDIAEPGAP